MTNKRLLSLNLVLLGVLLLGCEESNATDANSALGANDATEAPSNGGEVATSGTSGASATEGVNPGSNAGTNPSPGIAGTPGANAGIAGSVAGNGGRVASGGATTQSDSGNAETQDSGNTDVSDSGTTQIPIGEIPDPVDTPFVWGVGIGVTDLVQATQFYTDVMEMTLEKEVTREDREEVVLFATEADRGSRVVLMKYNDGRNTEKITAKLVFFSSNVTGTVAAATAAGYTSLFSVGVVAQLIGPSTYTHEILSIGGSTGTAGVPYLIAIGYCVSDLAAARRFYADAFAMEETTPWSGPITDATGAATIQEQTVEFSTQGGAGLVLQSWTPARNTKDNPIKVVFFLPNAQEYADKVVAAGGSIVQEAKRTDVYDNRCND